MGKSDKLELVGNCNICNKTYKKAGITRHLTKCLQSFINPSDIDDIERIFHIIVEDKYAPFWWLHIAISADTLLIDLDDFLRQIWLECCGHLSSFQINKEYYNRDKAGDFFGESIYDNASNTDDKNMDIPMGDILKVGMKFNHVYDWGTSTELKLLVKSVTPGFLLEDITLLARNKIPNFPCSYCKKKMADLICSICIWRTENWLFCNSCSNKHECGDDYYLPYLNSPRTGQCAYEDPLIDDD